MWIANNNENTKMISVSKFIPPSGSIPTEVVLEVLEDIRNGKTYREIADDYGVSLGWISKVKRKEIRGDR